MRVAAASVLALTCGLGISVGPVSAQAQHLRSTPPANATLSPTPSAVLITFSQELSNIRISVTGPDGSEVTTAPARFDLGHRQSASVPLSDDGPGVYTVLWRNVSGGDGDPNDGQFVFTVAGPAPSPAATVSAQTNAPAQPATPTPGADPRCNLHR